MKYDIDDSMKRLKTIVVGIGKQASEDHIPALLASTNYEIVSLVEKDSSKHHEIEKRYGITVYQSIEEATSADTPDAAVLTLPHSEYQHAVELLAAKGVHIIKEKPFAVSLDEAALYQYLMEKYNISIHVTLQRRFDPIFASVPQLIRSIGKIFAIEGKYTFNIGHLDEGWRANSSQSGGGALIDMGYHIVDLLVWYFDLPNYITASTVDGNREGQEYDVEDTIYLNFRYGEDDRSSALGNVIISRVSPEKQEYLHMYGTKGSVRVERGRVERFDVNGEPVESLVRDGQWPSALVEQYEVFAHEITRDRNSYTKDRVVTLHDHLKHMAIIEAGYQSAKSKSTINVQSLYHEMVQQLKEGIR